MEDIDSSEQHIKGESFPKEIYHLTSLKNLSNILYYGIISREKIKLDGLKSEDLSYPFAQEIRREKEFVSSKKNKINLNQCVPFYFAKDSPSNYLMWKDKKDHRVVLLVIDFIKLISSDIEFIFSDGCLAKIKKEGEEQVKVYSNIQDLNKLNWWIINYEDHRYFTSTAGIKKDKMAEFLVRDLVKPEFIREIIVSDDNLKIKVLELLTFYKGTSIPVIVEHMFKLK
jgi:hypothetical protein